MGTDKPRLLITMDEDLLRRIDDYRYDNRIPSRSATIRTLLENALADWERSKPDK